MILQPARRTVLLGGLAWATVAARAEGAPHEETPPLEAPLSSLEAWADAYGRPTAKVMLNGLGPFSFLVDTGANTTVLVARTARAIGVEPTGVALVNGTTGTAEMPTALLGQVTTGVVRRRNLDVAILPDEALPREDGILGADVFAGRRLVFEMQRKRVLVDNPSIATNSPGRFSAGNLRVRNGRLAEIDGQIGAIRVRMMLDTGAETCIVNRALERALLEAFPRLVVAERARVTGVTGQAIIGDYIGLPQAAFGGVILHNATGIAADASIFDLWGLTRTPAMIVGINVLCRLASFTIDYGARQFEAVPFALLAQGRVGLG